MTDLIAWLAAFFLLLGTLGIPLYQLVCLLDLEMDNINPYDSAARINRLVFPEYVIQGILCFIHFVTGHWTILLLCLPHLYYNARLYTRRQHLVDVTEIFNQLSWEKKLRLYKLGYLFGLLIISLFWMIWSIVEEE